MKHWKIIYKNAYEGELLDGDNMIIHQAIEQGMRLSVVQSIDKTRIGSEL